MKTAKARAGWLSALAILALFIGAASDAIATEFPRAKPVQVGSAFSGEWSHSDLLSFLFSGADVAQGPADQDAFRAHWSGDDPLYLNEYFPEETADRDFLSTIALSEQGEETSYVVTASAPLGYDCHVCAPLLVLHTLETVNGSSRLKSSIRIGTFGSWGTPSPVSLQEIGRDQHALLIRPAYLNMGFFQEDLLLYTWTDHAATLVLRVENTTNSNEGMCDDTLEVRSNPQFCYELRKEIEWEHRPGARYHDVIVRSRGTYPNSDGRVAPVDSTSVFRFNTDENRYKPGSH